MNIVCLDMEGVLVPEIWIAFAEESGIPELRRHHPQMSRTMTNSCAGASTCSVSVA